MPTLLAKNAELPVTMDSHWGNSEGKMTSHV